MRSYLIWGGVCSWDLGLVIERVPNQNRPARKVERYSVPGRNGDIIVAQDAWENVEQTYEVWGGNGAINDATIVGYAIAEWLCSKKGYQRLEDTYDPDHYRLAFFEGPYDFQSVLRRRGRAEITFSCDPRRFLTRGEEVIELNGTTIVVNPTSFTARPQMVVHGSGNGAIECGGNTITITGIYDGMVLDCDAQDAYYPGVNLNSLVSGEFPVIPGGDQTITITGGITSVEVTPNWWTL